MARSSRITAKHQFSVIQKKVVTPNDFASLGELSATLGVIPFHGSLQTAGRMQQAHETIIG